jgi:hypothetical protein
VNRSEKIPEKLILALDRNRLKVPHLPTIIDVRMILASIPKPMLREMIDVNPEAIGAVIKNVFFLMLKNKIKIVLANTRFNVNTPIEYHRAHKYFSSRDETG